MASSSKGPVRPNGNVNADDEGQGREPGSWLLGFGGTVGAALFGAMIACAPASFRLEASDRACGLVNTWTVLGAVSLLPMSLAIVTLRRARIGFVAFGKRGGLAQGPTLLLWILSTFALLTCLGATLRARTHHRALGGVVFAVTALILAAVLAISLVRLVEIAKRLPIAVRWWLGAVAAGGLGFLVAVARARMTTPAALPRAEGARLVDGLAFGLSALMASGSPLVARRSLALVGPPLAVVVVILGVSSLHACPPLLESLEEQAPLFAWLLSWSR
jgi:hypothetical protein